MDSSPEKRQLSWKPGLAALFILFLALVASRRWQQITTPQVWDEDGRVISDFITDGWRDFLQPVNGYLILIPRLVSGISLNISVYHYPILSTFLSCLFAAMVGLAVVVEPTRLRCKVLCAISIFLVPSDSEVFGLPLYTLWWAPLLLLLVALWDERKSALGFRLFSVVAGGLSSPFIVAVLPVLVFRALRPRKWSAEATVAAVAAAVSAVQAHFVVTGASVASPPVSSFVHYVIPRFCGWFLLGNFSENNLLLWPAGFLVILLIAAFLLKCRSDPSAWILVYLYCAAIASDIVRNDPAALHPFVGGPRYFFFPFILTFWILIQFAAAVEKRWQRLALALVALAGSINAIPVWTRNHDDLGWKEHLLSARQFTRYAIPIQYDGHRSRAWSIEEPGAVWDRMLRDDVLISIPELEGRPTFAYRILTPADLANEGYSKPTSVGPKGEHIDTIATIPGGMDIRLRLVRGQRILFRFSQGTKVPSMNVVGSEGAFIAPLPAATDWVTLEFSNAKLPEDFTVKIVDNGQGTGEWAEYGGN